MNLIQLQDHLHKLGCAPTLTPSYRHASNVAREIMADLELRHGFSPTLPVGELGVALRNLRPRGCYVVIDSPADGTTGVEVCATRAELREAVARTLNEYGNNTALEDKIPGYEFGWLRMVDSDRDLNGWVIADEAGGMHIEIRHFPDF